MKKLIYFAFLPLMGWAQVQNPELRIETPIKEVTLFLEGAEVNQQKLITLNAGITQLVFTNLSTKLIPKSIQVNVAQGIDVLSITEKLNYMTAQIESARVKQLKDSLNAEQLKLQILEADKLAYESEKELLSKNNSIGGQDKGVLVAELKLAADFYRSRMKEINGEIVKFENKIADSDLIIVQLENNPYICY